MSDNEELSSIEEIYSDEDFDNMPYECPKCGYEHEKYIDAEYFSCKQCIRFCCKACRTVCDKCNDIHCFRCTNYFENCCQTLCNECTWFCDIEEEYHCKCLEPWQCDNCEEYMCQKFINKRKNGNNYCEECNLDYCDNCDEYIDFPENEDEDEYDIEFGCVCYHCIKEIENIFIEKIPEELIGEILQFINL